MPRRRTCPTSTSPWRECAALPPRLPSYRLAARRPALGRFCAAQSADAPHRFASPASRATTVLAFRGRRFARPRSVSAEGRLLPNPSWSPSGPLHSLTSPESFPFEFATPPQTDPSPVPNAIAFESANPCTVETDKGKTDQNLRGIPSATKDCGKARKGHGRAHRHAAYVRSRT